MINEVTYFFLILIGTILITKIVLLEKRIHSPTIYGLRLHHWMYGIVLIFVGIVTKNLTMYAIGWALFIDQLPLIITNSWKWEDSYSRKTFVGIFISIVIIFVLRNYILRLVV